MDLHPKARKLLQRIQKEGGSVRVDRLEQDMSHGDVMRPAQWLDDDALITIDEEVERQYSLTATGEDAYVTGLPEKKLLEALEDGSRPIQELQQEIDAFNIALGQAKQNSWVAMQDGDSGKQLSLTDSGREKLDDGFDEQAILASIEEGDDVEHTDTLHRLVDRGLVEESDRSWQVLKITERGQETLDQLEEQEEAEKIEEKRNVGEITPEILRTGEWKERGIRDYNVEAETDTERPGKRHPYRQYLDEVRQKLMAMGFREAKTDLVEMEFWNFDVLFQAQDHPARELHDKFELEDPSHGDLMDDEIVERVRAVHEEGWELDSSGWDYEWSSEKASQLMLRSQTTATTIRYLAQGVDSPAKLFAIDRNFRYDEIDQTHFIEFYQAEGIVKAPDLSLRDLFGYLKVFGEEIAGAEKIRFRPGYFPFTEPSVELDAYHPEMGWIELGGAGLFRPEVRKPLGVDDPVIAWGMGIDRLAMFKLGIEDIRELVFPQDLDYLRRSPAVTLR